jgi:hypothetical protein
LDFVSLRLKQALIRVHVLVTAAGEVEDDQVAGLELRQAFDQTGDRVRRFQRWDDAFGAGKQPCGFERGGVRDRRVFSAMLIG